MINVDNLTNDEIKLFCRYYLQTKFMFSCAPEKASAKKQAKIRRFILNEELKSEDTTVYEWFKSEATDAEAMDFLKACMDKSDAFVIEEEMRFDRFAADLTPDVRSALRGFVYEHCFHSGVRVDENGDAEIVVDERGAVRVVLILRGVDGMPDPETEYFMENQWSFSRNADTGVYTLVGELMEANSDEIKLCAIKFKDADVRHEAYNCVDNVFLRETPFEMLAAIAGHIFEKAEIAPELVNDEEKALMPILSELRNLDYCEEESATFENLKKLCEKRGFKRLCDALSKYEKLKFTAYRAAMLTAEMNSVKYESLWREIYLAVKESQKDYPVKCDTLCDAELLASTRRKVERMMHERGYSGSYPNFVKEGRIRGIHNRMSYGMLYTVGCEKNVIFRVHCFESFEGGDSLVVMFASGTELVRKNISSEDIYTSMFDAKGKKYFSSCWYYVDENTEEELETCVGIATKNAEFGKFTKAEKSYYSMYNGNKWIEFFVTLVLFGFGFTVLFIPAMMIFISLILVCGGEAAEIPSMFTEIPWWPIILFCFFGTGIPMGLFTVFSRK